MKKIILISSIIMISAISTVQASSLAGTLVNRTFIRGGMLVMLDAGLPANCAGSPYGWIKVKTVDSELLKATMLLWETGNRRVRIYSDGRENGTGFCIVNQIDPSN